MPKISVPQLMMDRRAARKKRRRARRRARHEARLRRRRKASYGWGRAFFVIKWPASVMTPDDRLEIERCIFKGLESRYEKWAAEVEDQMIRSILMPQEIAGEQRMSMSYSCAAEANRKAFERMLEQTTGIMQGS